jgi:hypothetical protein
VKRVEVLHELMLEKRSGTLEKLRAQGSEDDAVDIEQQVSSVGTAVVDEQRGVRLRPPQSSGTTLVAPTSGRRGTC